QAVLLEEGGYERLDILQVDRHILPHPVIGVRRGFAAVIDHDPIIDRVRNVRIRAALAQRFHKGFRCHARPGRGEALVLAAADPPAQADQNRETGAGEGQGAEVVHARAPASPTPALLCRRAVSTVSTMCGALSRAASYCFSGLS